MRPASVLIVLLSATIVASAALIVRYARGGDKQLCHLEPGLTDGWHYRTKIPPLLDQRCYYQGTRMKPRSELYWAGAPTIPPPMSVEGEFELRFKGETR